MAHTAPPTNKHRRVERIIGVLLALVGLAVATIAIVALNHPQGRSAVKSSRIPTASDSSLSTSASKSATKSASPTKKKNSPANSSVPTRPALIVLNNSARTGLASTAADRFRAAGWTVTSTGDFSGDILSTAAYYDSNVSGAQAAAEALQRQFPAIQRVKQRFSGLPEGPIVVVLTTDYS
jgi:hypothetical protein